jgi:hypothetical protein
MKAVLFDPMRDTFLMLLLVSGLFLGSQRTLAQEAGQVTAAFVPDTPAPLIGQPFKLALAVKAPKAAIVTLPELTEDFPPFMVREVGEVIAKVDGEQATYQQTLTVILWRPGQYETPDLFVQYQLPETSEVFNLPVDKAVLNVPSVLQEGDANLRPFKAQIYLPYLSPWLVAGLIVLGGAAAFGVRRLAKSGRVRLLVLRPTASAVLSPAERAVDQLKRLQARNLPPETLFPQVTDCLRVYLEHRFEIPAPDLTTLELIHQLQASNLLPERRQRELQQLLERADLVKFARVQPDQQVSSRFIEAAVKWVEVTDNAAEVSDEVTA